MKLGSDNSFSYLAELSDISTDSCLDCVGRLDPLSMPSLHGQDWRLPLGILVMHNHMATANLLKLTPKYLGIGRIGVLTYAFRCMELRHKIRHHEHNLVEKSLKQNCTKLSNSVQMCNGLPEVDIALMASAARSEYCSCYQ